MEEAYRVRTTGLSLGLLRVRPLRTLSGLGGFWGSVMPRGPGTGLILRFRLPALLCPARLGSQ
eukprot:11916404-Heterocapsa_arctica.AAC.1